MTEKFRKRVLNEIIVDTKKYRYINEKTMENDIIKRCPIKYIGTTKALDPWEIIWKRRK